MTPPAPATTSPVAPLLARPFRRWYPTAAQWEAYQGRLVATMRELVTRGAPRMGLLDQVEFLRQANRPLAAWLRSLDGFPADYDPRVHDLEVVIPGRAQDAVRAGEKLEVGGR